MVSNNVSLVWACPPTALIFSLFKHAEGPDKYKF